VGNAINYRGESGYTQSFLSKPRIVTGAFDRRGRKRGLRRTEKMREDPVVGREDHRTVNTKE